MNNTYQIYLISDSTGETLERIFLALKAQFKNFNYKIHQYSFTRTENQILKILDICKKQKNSIILYTIVDSKLAKFLDQESSKIKISCFGVLGDLIISFSKLLKQEASHIPSGQHVLDDEYYKRIEAIQFTMMHDDGKKTEDMNDANIILLGISRTGKTPTSIYLANRGFKTMNIPLVNKQEIPDQLKTNDKKICVVGLFADPERLSDIRKNRVSIMSDSKIKNYNHFFKNKEKELIMEIEKYLKEKTALI